MKRRTQRDESLCTPHHNEERKESASSASSVVSDLTIQEREAILEALSKDMDEPLDRSLNNTALWKRSCMLLLATAGVTTMAATSPRALVTLFASKK